MAEWRALLVFLGSFAFASGAAAREGAPPLDALTGEARRHGQTLSSPHASEADRTLALQGLAAADRAVAMPLFIWALERDPSPAVRVVALKLVATRRDPAVFAALTRVTVSDPDPRNVIFATERLQAMRASEAAEVLSRRVNQARAAGDLTAAKLLAGEQERWLLRRTGGGLPGFLRRPPPTFALKPAARRVRVLAYGDFGKGTDNQKNVAEGMRRFHRKERFDFGLTAGDNFYSTGLSSPDDPRWKTQWEDLYSPMRVPIYATLGNHDWGHPDSPLAEILYTQKSKTWRMPAPYYTFTAGPAQFFALDTDRMSEAQLIWIQEQLAASQATWKIVYGHHPIYSYGKHGDTDALVARLLPILEGQADLYVCGHEHDLQHLQLDRGLQQVVTGGAGAELRAVDTGPRTIWAQSRHGFTVLDIDGQRLRIRFVDEDGKTLHDHTRETRVAEAVPGGTVR